MRPPIQYQFQNLTPAGKKNSLNYVDRTCATNVTHSGTPAGDATPSKHKWRTTWKQTICFYEACDGLCSLWVNSIFFWLFCSILSHKKYFRYDLVVPWKITNDSYKNFFFLIFFVSHVGPLSDSFRNRIFPTSFRYQSGLTKQAWSPLTYIRNISIDRASHFQRCNGVSTIFGICHTNHSLSVEFASMCSLSCVRRTGKRVNECTVYPKPDWIQIRFMMLPFEC